MKNRTVRFRPQKSAFKVTGFIFMWVLSFIVAIVFTQALRNSVSYVFFIIVCALPPLDLIYTFIAASSVRASFSCSAEKAEKKEPVEFCVTLANGFILPLPFVEAELILPQTGGLCSADTYIRVPLTALGKSVYRKRVSFPYKGAYSCGVSNVYVSGLLRFFRIKTAVNKSGGVTVFPRRITAPLLERSVNDAASTAVTSVSGADRAEINEIKVYVPGDPIGNIHWKLSTKVEDLMSKHFGTENGLMTCVIADTGRHYTPASDIEADVNEYCDDALCEICCFLLTSALYEGRKAALVYNDTHKTSDLTERKTFDGISSFEDFLPYYVACGVPYPVSPKTLTGYCEDGADNDIIYVTSKLTDETVSSLCELQSADRAVTLVLFEPYSKMSDPSGQKAAAEVYLQELAAVDVIIQRISEDEFI